MSGSDEVEVVVAVEVDVDDGTTDADARDEDMTKDLEADGAAGETNASDRRSSRDSMHK